MISSLRSDNITKCVCLCDCLCVFGKSFWFGAFKAFEARCFLGIIGVSRVFSKVFIGPFDIRWVFKGCFIKGLRKFMKLSRRGKFRDASRVFQYFQVSFQHVLMFPVCFKGVSSMLQETSGRFNKSFLLLGIHRSFPSRRRACLR